MLFGGLAWGVWVWGDGSRVDLLSGPEIAVDDVEIRTGELLGGHLDDLGEDAPGVVEDRGEDVGPRQQVGVVHEELDALHGAVGSGCLLDAGLLGQHGPRVKPVEPGAETAAELQTERLPGRVTRGKVLEGVVLEVDDVGQKFLDLRVAIGVVVV